jgi:hypothetical protein
MPQPAAAAAGGGIDMTGVSITPISPYDQPGMLDQGGTSLPSGPYGTGSIGASFAGGNPVTGYNAATGPNVETGFGSSAPSADPNAGSAPPGFVSTAPPGTTQLGPGATFVGTDPAAGFGNTGTGANAGGPIPGDTGSASGGSPSGTGQGQTPGGASGMPVDITKGNVNVQLGFQQPLTQQTTSWIQSVVDAFGTAAEKVFSFMFGGVINWFARGFLMMLALVIIIIALIALTKKEVAA